MHPNQLSDWKTQFQEKSSQVFGNAPAKLANPDIKTMQAKIGQLTLENDFFGKCAHQGGPAERKKRIDRTHDLPIVRQCEILRLARSTAYYTPEPTSSADFALMQGIDELHLYALLPAAGCFAVRSDWKASQSEESLYGR